MKNLSFLFAALVAGMSVVASGADTDYALIPYSSSMVATASAKESQREPILAINGAGLYGDNCHTNGEASGTMWSPGTGKKPHWFMVDLGETYDLGKIKVWNFNFTRDSQTFMNRGAKEVDFYYSNAEGSVGGTFSPDEQTWTKLLSTNLVQATGAVDYPGMDPFVFKPVLARYVLLVIKSDLGGGYGGLSEIQFYKYTAEIPEPKLGGCEITCEGGAFTVSATMAKNTAQTVTAYAYASEDDANPVAQVIGTNVAAGETAMGVLTGLAPDTMYKIVVKADSGEAGADKKEIKTAIYTGEISIVKVQDGREFGNPAIAEVSRGAATSYDLTVAYAVGGTAKPGVNYEPLSGTVTIPAGSASAQVVVTPMFDQSADATSVILTLGDGLYSISGSANTVTLTIESGKVPEEIVFDGEVLVYEGFSANDYTFAASTGAQRDLSGARKKDASSQFLNIDNKGLGGNGWSSGRDRIYGEGDGLELPTLMREAGMSALGTSVGMDISSRDNRIRSAHLKLNPTVLAPDNASHGKFYFRLLMNVDSTAAAVMTGNDALDGGNGNSYGAGFLMNPSDNADARHFTGTSGIVFFIQKKKDGSLKAVLGVTDKDGSRTYYEMGDAAADKTYIFYAEVTPIPGADMIRAGYQDVANYNPSVSKLWKVKDIFQNVYDGDSYPNVFTYGGCFGTNGGYFRVDEFRVGTGINTILKVSKGGMMILVR